MRATYCPTCDETRWQLSSLPITRATTCATCGTKLQTERRHPGRRRLTDAPVERRTAVGDGPVGAAPA